MIIYKHLKNWKEVMYMKKLFCSTKGKEIEYTQDYANTSDLEKESKEPLRKVCIDRDMDCCGKKCPLNH